MKIFQKVAVERNMTELVMAAEWTVPISLNYFQERGVLSNGERELIEGHTTSGAKLLHLLNVLKEKDSGWDHLLSYLESNNQSLIAVKLQDDANAERTKALQEAVNYDNERANEAVKEFSLRVAHYYQHNYVHLPTMGEFPKHVSDAWVPLQIDGRKEDFLESDRIDHVGLLNRLASSTMHNVALIKGDPGMGKTTLAKRIAYEWATQTAKQFSLVLAVPLRHAQKSSQFDQLAIDYFLAFEGGQLGKNIDTGDLLSGLKQLNSQLLVILDGLDEYGSYAQSPFKNVFARPFQRYTSDSNVPAPTPHFKLIITSRPYACQRINAEFWPLRFVILPLDANNLAHFVKHYCQTQHGAEKVMEYFSANAGKAIMIPLILTFVCYLADSVQEIPTNMTSLYDSFTRQMLRREHKQEKLEESVDIRGWRESRVMRTTSELAYRQAMVDSFAFTSDALSTCRVTNDSFICGFLLHKFDFAKENLIAEFPHRSIQEFFAALHCYQLMLNGNTAEALDVCKLAGSEDSLVGRFFWGICSKEGRFHQLANWLGPLVNASALDLFPPPTVVSQLLSSLTDCSSEDNRTVGHILFESVGDLESTIASSWNHRVNLSTNVKRCFDGSSNAFKEAIHLRAIIGRSGKSERIIGGWFLADINTAARLAYAGPKLLEIPLGMFNEATVLILRYTDWQRISGQLKSLPEVKTLVITTDLGSRFTSVTTCINYRCKLKWRMNNFRLDYIDRERNVLLTSVANENCVDLIAHESEHQNSDSFTFRHISVTVNDPSISQSTLVWSLVRISMKNLEKAGGNITGCCCKQS